MADLLKAIPTAFISYSWDSANHKEWVKRLGTRLRSDGIDLTLDEWKLTPGDRLTQFMETAIRDSDFVLIVCTPTYRAKSDSRAGGVGYEGHIVTSELMTYRNNRKFIPILREGEWREAAPSSLLGNFYIDLRGEPYAEANYEQLLSALRGILPDPPPLGTPPMSLVSQPIDMVGVTHQKVYADFINSAGRIYEITRNRMFIKKHSGTHALAKLPRIERDLERQLLRVHGLQGEIDLLASKPVMEAAGEVTAWLIACSHYSAETTLESAFEHALSILREESFPKYRTTVRNELNARAASPNSAAPSDQKASLPGR